VVFRFAAGSILYSSKKTATSVESEAEEEHKGGSQHGSTGRPSFTLTASMSLCVRSVPFAACAEPFSAPPARRLHSNNSNQQQRQALVSPLTSSDAER
jgi:hypothetical protein